MKNEQAEVCVKNAGRYIFFDIQEYYLIIACWTCLASIFSLNYLPLTIIVFIAIPVLWMLHGKKITQPVNETELLFRLFDIPYFLQFRIYRGEEFCERGLYGKNDIIVPSYFGKAINKREHNHFKNVFVHELIHSYFRDFETLLSFLFFSIIFIFSLIPVYLIMITSGAPIIFPTLVTFPLILFGMYLFARLMSFLHYREYRSDFFSQAILGKRYIAYVRRQSALRAQSEDALSISHPSWDRRFLRLKSLTAVPIRAFRVGVQNGVIFTFSTVLGLMLMFTTLRVDLLSVWIRYSLFAIVAILLVFQIYYAFLRCKAFLFLERSGYSNCVQYDIGFFISSAFVLFFYHLSYKFHISISGNGYFAFSGREIITIIAISILVYCIQFFSSLSLTLQKVSRGIMKGGDYLHFISMIDLIVSRRLKVPVFHKHLAKSLHPAAWADLEMNSGINLSQVNSTQQPDLVDNKSV